MSICIRGCWRDGKNLRNSQALSESRHGSVIETQIHNSFSTHKGLFVITRMIFFFIFSWYRVEAFFEVNTDLQKKVQAKISAQLTWPSLINSSQQVLFPLTNINSSSVSPHALVFIFFHSTPGEKHFEKCLEFVCAHFRFRFWPLLCFCACMQGFSPNRSISVTSGYAWTVENIFLTT